MSSGGSAGYGGSAGTGGSGGSVPFALTSPAFTEGQTIPSAQECTQTGGQDLSPALNWTPGPVGTQSYAIVMRDLDLNFVHWVIWDIPGNVLSLPENVEQTFMPSVPAGAKQAALTPTVTGYFGPCSPNAVDTYELTVYALPVPSLSGIDQTSTSQQAADAIVAAATAHATLSGES